VLAHESRKLGSTEGAEEPARAGNSEYDLGEMRDVRDQTHTLLEHLNNVPGRVGAVAALCERRLDVAIIASDSEREGREKRPVALLLLARVCRAICLFCTPWSLDASTQSIGAFVLRQYADY
jgi:hypothetical protein